MLKKISLILLVLVFGVNCQARGFANFSKNLGNKNYLLYVNKTEKLLYIVGKDMKAVKTFTITTGEVKGRKLHAGDKMTPEGNYKITQVLSSIEPGYLKKAKASLEAMDKNVKTYWAEKHIYDSANDEFKKNKKALAKMNAVFFKASEGHKKFGTQEDLGFSVYGPAFLRLDYPNAEDKKRYADEMKKGNVLKKTNGGFYGIGAGIGIHGTNDDPSLGQDASSGCVRMKNEDLLEVMEFVEKGMTVIIEN